MKTAPKSAPTLIRGLTHQIDYGDWRAPMESTQKQSKGFRTPERWNSVLVPERVARRAYENVTPGPNGCWISTYSVGSHGYAQVGWQDSKVHTVLAHRAAWVHVNGQMPLGMTLDHLCKTRRCVNPDHLRLLPNYENARRTGGRDWPLGYCPNGHPNSLLVRSGTKGPMTCGECVRAKQAQYRARVASGEHVPVHTRPEKCKRGHDMTGDNARQAKRGEWLCKQCRRDHQNAYKARKRAEETTP